MGVITCPTCGSWLIERDTGRWDWVWRLAAAESFVMRLLVTFVRYGEYRGEPGIYRCNTCGRTFTFVV